MFRMSLLLFIICMAACGKLRAAEAGAMKFTTYWPCSGSSSFCGVRILAQGVIERDSGRKFQQFIANRRAHKHELPPVPTVDFDSPGGNVLGAMDLGRTIRKLRMETGLSASYSQLKDGSLSEDEVIADSAACASACVLAFAGGVKRTVSTDARLGVHQFYAPNGSIGDGATQVTLVMLGAYFEELGVRRSLLDLASLTPPSKMRWLVHDEAKRYRLDNTTQDLASWSVKPTIDGIATLELVQPISQGRTLFLRVMPVGVGIGIGVAAEFQKSSVRDVRIAQFPLGQKTDVLVCGEKNCIRARPATAWSRTENSTSVRFHIIALIRRDELKLLGLAKELSIDDGFGTATSDISISTDLSTDGFSEGVALILRQSN